MKQIASRILHKIAMNPSSDRRIERFIQAPLMNLLSRVIYSEHRIPFNLKSFLKSNRSIFYAIIIACSLFVGGLLTQRSITDDLFWKYKTVQYQLYQRDQLNAELQLKLATIISKRDFLRYRAFETSGVLIPDHVPTKHIQLMFDQADKRNIPYNILFRMIKQESQFNKLAISHKGATGYMQIMPGTFKEYGKRINIYQNTFENNIIVGTYILSELHSFWKIKHSDKAWELALASYNAGLGSVKSYQAIPPYQETQKYVAYILSTP